MNRFKYIVPKSVYSYVHLTFMAYMLWHTINLYQYIPTNIEVSFAMYSPAPACIQSCATKWLNYPKTYIPSHYCTCYMDLLIRRSTKLFTSQFPWYVIYILNSIIYFARLHTYLFFEVTISFKAFFSMYLRTNQFEG